MIKIPNQHSTLAKKHHLHAINRTSIIIVALLLSILPFVYANIFDVGVTICTPQWYCTNFSQGDCGIRDCIDSNACQRSNNMPEEYIACALQPSPSGGGGGSRGGSSNTNEYSTKPTERQTLELPQGYFTTDTEFIRITELPGNSGTRTIKLKPQMNDTYRITITYPEGYNQSKTIIISKYDTIDVIAGKIAELTLYFNTTGIAQGTYILTTQIAGKTYTKNITTIITVSEKTLPIKYDVRVNPNIDAINQQYFLNTHIYLKEKIVAINNSISYKIIDPSGNTIAQDIKEFTGEDTITHKLLLPLNLENGYYTLVTTVMSGEVASTQNIQFTILSEKYHVIESPKSIATITQISGKTLKGILLAVVLIGGIIGGIAIYHYNQKHKYDDKKERFRELQHKIGNLIKRKRVTVKTRERIIEDLYTQGFITASEEGVLLNQKDIKKALQELRDKYDVSSVPIVPVTNVEDSIHKSTLTPPITIPITINAKEDLPNTTKEAGSTPIPEEVTPFKKEILPDTHSTLHTHGEERRQLFEKIIAEDKAFYLKNGQVLHSIKELHMHLAKGDLDTFNYHTQQGRNDFADWIAGVFNDTELATMIRNAKNINALKKGIEEYFLA